MESSPGSLVAEVRYQTYFTPPIRIPILPESTGNTSNDRGKSGGPRVLSSNCVKGRNHV